MSTVVIRIRLGLGMMVATAAVLAAGTAWAAETTPVAPLQPDGEQAAEKPAESAGETAAAETSGLTGENALLAREANLNAEQKERLAKTVAEGTKAMNDWRQRNRDKIASFQQAVSTARQARDQAAFQKAIQDHQEMLKEQVALQAKFNQQVMDILTLEQEGTWFGFVLCRNLTQQAKAADLSDEQKTKTRSLCNDAAGKLAALRRSEKTDQEKAVESRTIQGGLVQTFMNDVLTDAQRTQIRSTAGAAPPPAPVQPVPTDPGPAAEPAPPAGDTR